MINLDIHVALIKAFDLFWSIINPLGEPEIIMIMIMMTMTMTMTITITITITIMIMIIIIMNKYISSVSPSSEDIRTLV